MVDNSDCYYSNFGEFYTLFFPKKKVFLKKENHHSFHNTFFSFVSQSFSYSFTHSEAEKNHYKASVNCYMSR